MGPRSGSRSLGGLAALAACAVLLAACGGSGSQDRSGAQSSTGAGDQPASGGLEGTATERRDQQASDLHLSRADCAVLAAHARAGFGTAVRTRSEPTPPLSHCRLIAPGADVNVYLDTGHSARQRYENRMTEQVQFGAPDRAKLPRPVAGVGERGAYDHYASWIPALDTLFAVRGNRWVTVSYAHPGVPGAALLAEAAKLARAAFRLSAE